jgi:toxin CcdB
MQFAVHRLAGRPGLVVDCQTDLLGHIDTRFVVPLVARDEAPSPVRPLNPVFQIEGAEFVMLTQAAAAVRRRNLGEEVGSLADRDREIMNALDFLLTGA